MSIPSYRSTGDFSPDFVVHTAHHTPLGKSDLDPTFVHPNCECGSTKDSENFIMSTEYGECELLCPRSPLSFSRLTSISKPEREYNHISSLPLPGHKDSATSTPGGDVTSALERLAVTKHPCHSHPVPLSKQQKLIKKQKGAQQAELKRGELTGRLKDKQHHLHTPDEVLL